MASSPVWPNWVSKPPRYLHQTKKQIRLHSFCPRKAAHIYHNIHSQTQQYHLNPSAVLALTLCGPWAGCCGRAPAGTHQVPAKSTGSRRVAPLRSGRIAGKGRRTWSWTRWRARRKRRSVARLADTALETGAQATSHRSRSANISEEEIIVK